MCKKITNVLPGQRETFSYHQQRNDILPELARLLVNRTPVKRTCEILGIGSQTYYSKLEWLYRRCLEFLERHETQSLANRLFGTMWIDTDQLIYFLNNVRKHGKGGARYEDTEEPTFPTHVVVSAEASTRYVLRADVAYDWHVSIEDVANDTAAFKDAHLNEYARRHARLRFSYAPQPPTENDTQTDYEFQQELRNFIRRANYIDGLHVKASYTALAHYWLIRQTINAKEWWIVSDEDGALMTAIYRAFAPEIRRAEAHHFLCKTDRSKTRKQAFAEFRDCEKELMWGTAWGYDHASVWKLARLRLEHMLETHRFDELYDRQGRIQRRWAKNPIQHPLATVDKGYYDVDCTTDLSA